MMLNQSHKQVQLALVLLCCFAPVPKAAAAEVESSATEAHTPGSSVTDKPVEPPGTAPQTTAQETPTGLSVGVDIYSGFSSLTGAHGFNDGFWVGGTGPAFPSNVYLHYASRNGSAAHLALGTGRLYRGAGRLVSQPYEVWYKQPLGKTTFTLGKYYVPFSLLEWEYETKYGVMAERAFGPYSVTASLNYNGDTDAPNAYLRGSRTFGENLNVGVSLGGGKGLSYNSVHNRAAGVDLTAKWRGWQLLAEYEVMRRRSDERFRFGFAKVSYENLSRFKPFIGRYSWNDTTGELGRLRNTVVGFGYQLKPGLALETGYARTSDEPHWWAQIHWTWERSLSAPAK
jgi:hypothetical protein